MHNDLRDSDILRLCKSLKNQLSYRFVALKYLSQPAWQDHRPLSISGSLRGGGRFNVSQALAKANPSLSAFGAIYTSLLPETAVAEMRFPTAQEIPYLLLPIRSSLERCLDLREVDTCNALGLNKEALYADWREVSKIELKPAYSQYVAARLNSALVEGILTESIAGEGTNLTLFPKTLRGGSRVSLSSSEDDTVVRDVWLPPPRQTP